ncbi:hypothetical protein [Sphingobium sp. EM0848]|uniref:hypothetical protein n=1 Tax=Sphingobium sp. EM0848 TaxID=2743473 RepID=UPI001C3FC41C|nr:hypothetical protein [Sphingobium sp. EM0848]
MIDDLIIGTTANFFSCQKPINAAVVERLFTSLRSGSRKPSTNLFRHVREAHDGSVISAICFSHERAAGFLTAEKMAFDRVHGFLLIVERASHIAIFKSGLELPTTFKGRHLARANPGSVEAAIATAEAIFEKVRVKSTSQSKQGVRAKTVEANNLEEAMPLASANGFFAQGYSVARADGFFSATPGTGRIAKRSDKGDAAIAIEWAAEVMDQLEAGGATNARFIRNFARRLGLDALPPDTTPITFALDTPQLSELLLAETPLIRLVRKDPTTGNFTQLTVAEVEDILAAIGEVFPVRPGRPDFRIKRGARNIGTIRMTKTRIALRALNMPQVVGIEVEHTEFPVGDDEDRKAFVRYLDRENLFTILFTDPTIAYLEGEVFRNEAMQDGGANFLRHLLPSLLLGSATSEKGEFEIGQEQFGEGSVFRQIADEIAVGDDVLICDDLGDEWADFIGLNTQSRPPSVSFYHGKHGTLTLGASAFHVSVSQAQKNLGRLTLAADAMEAKYQGWAGNYTSGSGVATEICKIIRGGEIVEIRQKIDEIRWAPDAVRHVYIVTSSLSKQAVQDAFTEIASGGRPSAHFVQLFWLLTNYYSACAEMGAVGFVVCQP